MYSGILYTSFPHVQLHAADVISDSGTWLLLASFLTSCCVFDTGNHGRFQRQRGSDQHHGGSDPSQQDALGGCLGWRMHCGAEVTESSTNKQHHISLSQKWDAAAAADKALCPLAMQWQKKETSEVVSSTTCMYCKTVYFGASVENKPEMLSHMTGCSFNAGKKVFYSHDWLFT